MLSLGLRVLGGGDLAWLYHFHLGNSRGASGPLRKTGPEGKRQTDILGERSLKHSRREGRLHGNGWATTCNGNARQTRPSQIKHPRKKKRNFKIRINKGPGHSLLVSFALGMKL